MPDKFIISFIITFNSKCFIIKTIHKIKFYFYSTFYSSSCIWPNFFIWYKFFIWVFIFISNIFWYTAYFFILNIIRKCCIKSCCKIYIALFIYICYSFIFPSPRWWICYLFNCLCYKVAIFIIICLLINDLFVHSLLS